MMNELKPEGVNRLAALGGPVFTGALLIWFASWTGPERSSAAINAIWLLLTSGLWVLAWLAAALGFGWPLRSLLVPPAKDALAIQIGLGVAALLVLDAALGALGMLQLGGSIGAWVTDYEANIRREQMEELCLGKLEDAQVFVIVNKYGEALTANLQGPLVINLTNQQAMQLVLADKRWTTRHEIVRIAEPAEAMSA